MQLALLWKTFVFAFLGINTELLTSLLRHFVFTPPPADTFCRTVVLILFKTPLGPFCCSWHTSVSRLPLCFHSYTLTHAQTNSDGNTSWNRNTCTPICICVYHITPWFLDLSCNKIQLSVYSQCSNSNKKNILTNTVSTNWLICWWIQWNVINIAYDTCDHSIFYRVRLINGGTAVNGNRQTWDSWNIWHLNRIPSGFNLTFIPAGPKGIVKTISILPAIVRRMLSVCWAVSGCVIL